MAYNVNTLIRAYIVQEYWKEKNTQGLNGARIYFYIRHLYPISKSTYYNYLTIPALRELKKQFTNQEIDDIKRLKDYALYYLQLLERIIRTDTPVTSYRLV